MVHYPDKFTVDEATPPPPAQSCSKCGGDLKFSPATQWTDEGYGCMQCGLFTPYLAAAQLR